MSNNHKLNQSNITYYQETLRKKGIVNITAFFDENIINSLIKETEKTFVKKLKRKDFLSQHTEFTPRNMYTVSELDVAKESKLIKDFYYSQQILGLITSIANEKANPLPWTGERFVINGLIENNDTHGWHWDDYAYAVIFIAQCPPQSAGGLVECIPHTQWDRKTPNIKYLLATKKVDPYHFKPGSFYLMKSDTTLHRVSPITGSYQRLSIAMSYCNENDLKKSLDHKTVIDLYS